MMPPDDHWLERAQRAASTRHQEAFELQLLPPYGSLRRYVRVRTGDRSEMLMLLPDPRARASDAGTSYDHAPADDPFIKVATWLHHANVRVPHIYATDNDARGIWLEDLGAHHLQDALRHERFDRDTAYHRALSLLDTFQRAAQTVTPPAFTQNKSLDHDLLVWECEHYVEWRLTKRLGVTLEADERRALHKSFLWIADQLRALPQITVHRDFQSHNIMVLTSGEFAIIDFQDCLRGPVPYDAVALLRDSYIVLRPEELESYVRSWARTTLSTLPAFEGGEQRLIRAFHLQTIQRKLKDTGRFELFALQQGKTNYLEYLPASVGYIRDAMRALSDVKELEALHHVLTRYEPLYA